jgi:phage terminase small subunit
MALSKKQLMFADEYIITGNAIKSAMRAGYSKKTAYKNGYRLLDNEGIKNYIKEFIDERNNERIASKEEVLETITNIMRRKSKDYYVEIDENGKSTIKEKDIPNSIVLKACEHFIKIYYLRDDKDKENKFHDININLVGNDEE